MIDETFRKWLVQKGMSNKSAGDVLSRCRRVEKTLNLSISDTVSDLEEAEKVASRVREHQSRFFNSNVNLIFSLAVIIRAVMLYGEYRESK